MGIEGATLVTELSQRNESCIRRFQYPWGRKTESKKPTIKPLMKG